MFTGSLSEAEQSVYGRLVDAVIRADGRMHDKELAYRVRFTALDQTAPTSSDDDVVVPEGAFDSAGAQAALLIDLCLIACADGTVTAEERAVLDGVAEAFGASRGRVDRLLEFATEMSALLDRGVELQAEGVR